MKVLLVDDTKKHRKAGVDQLTAAGHEVVAFSSYKDAVKSVRDGDVYDVALIDLLMPAEGMTLGGEGLQFLGQSLDIGYSLAMKLAMDGIKRIIVVTDMNHHHHPASAIMDWFLGKTLEICKSEVQFTHAWLTSDGAKDWSKTLEEFLK